MNKSPWYTTSYARLLIDNHISDLDPSFMRRFDPAEYVARVKQSGADSALVYACDHNGNCYYPTRIGHRHANLQGRDVFGEMIRLLKSVGIQPSAYYTVIYHNQAAKDHPEWRVRRADGSDHDRRYWLSCPSNRGYVDFAQRQIAEVLAYPELVGLFIDMTFWPGVCVCPACRRRYREEAGAEIPEVVNGEDPAWVGFQRARERWMAAFAAELTADVKTRRPDLSVVHQFSPVLAGWYLGQSPGVAAACDYASGDFYGGRHQHRLGTKVMAAFSANRPHEFMTSRCVTLYDHTSMKSEAEMTCSAATTLASGGAYMFIDAINPDGTLSPAVFERLGRVARTVEPFKRAVAALRPRLAADVGLYFSMDSLIGDFTGMKLSDLEAQVSNMDVARNIPALKEILGASIALVRARIPYRIVTARDEDLCGLRAIIVNDAAYLSAAEVERLRAFTAAGGTLVATGMTSFRDERGRTSGNFLLKDVFGVSYAGRQSRRVNYLCLDGEEIVCLRPAPLVRATTARSLGKVAEPIFDPDDPERYAAIHSNPPGPAGEFDGLTVNEFGRGRCVYLYSSLLSLLQDAQQEFGARFLREHAASGLLLDCNAPACVEVTVLEGAARKGFLVCLVNQQEELPNIPVRDVRLTVRLPGGWTPSRCARVSDGQAVDVRKQGAGFVLSVPILETVEMFEFT